MGRHPAVALTMALIVAAGSVSCGMFHSNPTAKAPTTVIAAALPGMLLSAADINSVMGTSGMTVSADLTDVSDHSILLPNRNCLGIWNVAEKAIYSDSNYAAMHGQTLRQPNTDSWVYKVDQVVFNYASADAAKQFFVLSADRWSKCTNHKVNMNVNNQQMPTVSFGQLTRTDTKLTMNLTRGDGVRSCQRALSVAANVIIDVAACATTTTDQASAIADKISSKISS